MKLSNPFPSYSQYNEDIILAALLFDVENGFYVDVGANYSTIDSVTKLFYENNWNGINIEPIPNLHELLQQDRPRDINLNIGISNEVGMLDFYENISVPGHSSFNKSGAAQSPSDVIKEYKVEIRTLRSIFISNKVKIIHFLKIDVEGYEDEVIESNNWKKFRPEAICVESNNCETKWQQILKNNKYNFFISDGVNEYYVSEEAWHRTIGFADRVIQLSHQALKYYQYDDYLKTRKQLDKVTKLNKIHFNLASELQKNNVLSLSGVNLPTRLVRSAYGLTIDWFKYRLGVSKNKK